MGKMAATNAVWWQNADEVESVVEGEDERQVGEVEEADGKEVRGVLGNGIAEKEEELERKREKKKEEEEEEEEEEEKKKELGEKKRELKEEKGQEDQKKG